MRTVLILLVAHLCPAQDVTVLKTPAKVSSGQAFLNRGADGVVRMSWVETEGRTARLLFSALGPEGWSAPRKIAHGDRWFVNWADVPSIAADARGNIAAHWLDRLGDDTYAYGVRIALSTDKGATFKKPFWLHDDRSPQEHGFCTLLPNADVGRVHDSTPGFKAVWLDGRALKDTDEMQLRTRFIGADGRLGKESLLDPRVCECCPTAMARGGDGFPLTVYRDRSATEVRDISIVRAGWFGWGKPRTLNADGWERPG